MAGAAGALMAGLAVAFGSATVDAVAVGGCLVWLGLLLQVHRAARAWRSRPLELAERAVWSWQDGERLIRFQGWLGDGRCCRPLSAEVLFLPEGAEARALPTRLPPGSAVGPFVVSAAHPPGSAGEGRYRVRVVVQEGGRTWAAEREVSASLLVAGRFAPALVDGSPRLRFLPSAFGRVEPWPSVPRDPLEEGADEAWQG